jgi:hypothetical protein
MQSKPKTQDITTIPYRGRVRGGIDEDFTRRLILLPDFVPMHFVWLTGGTMPPSGSGIFLLMMMTSTIDDCIVGCLFLLGYRSAYVGIPEVRSVVLLVSFLFLFSLLLFFFLVPCNPSLMCLVVNYQAQKT